MFAIKGNKEVKILEVQKDEYIKKGYTILNDKLETIERPQNQLENVRDGKYMSEYNYNTNNSNSNDTSKQTGNSSNTTNTNDKNNINETISRTQHDKANIYLMFQNDIQNIYNWIFDELDELFYGIV